MKDNLKPAQQKASNQLSKTLRTYGIALLWGQIRSGKSRSFLDASRGYRTLVVTKKDSMGGVLSEAKEIGVEVDVINYHSVQKMNPDDYQLIVLDECHLYISQSTPKASTIWKEVVKFTRGKFCIFASGTPTPEGYGGLFWMLALSSWTPFKYKSFTDWFKDYGIPDSVWNGERLVKSYKKTQTDKIKKAVKHLVVKLTRKKTGHKHEAQDVYHNVPMSKSQKKIYKKVQKKLVWSKGRYDIIADTPVKLLSKLHQLSGGIGVKCEPEVIDNPKFKKLKKKVVKKMTFEEREAYEDSKYLYKERIYFLKDELTKVEYIQEHFNPDTTIILSHYKHEQKFLADIFPHTGSVTKLSTGVDLSHFKTMVVYSMAFSSANYEQVKGRLMNVHRETEIDVNYLICGIDEYVLKAVKSKENFTASWYKENA